MVIISNDTWLIVLRLSSPLLAASLAFSFCPVAQAKPCHQSDIGCAQLVQWALDYPFVQDRRSSDYLFIAGGVYQFEKFDPNLGQAAVIVPGERRAMPVNQLLRVLEVRGEHGKKRTPVIAYGGNAAPWILADKFTRLYGQNKDYQGSMMIPVTKATLKDYDVTWLPHFAGYGVLPSTISTAPGTEVEVWLNWLTDEQLALMNQSEEVGSKGGMYSLNVMPKEQLKTNGYQLSENPLVYVSCYGALRAPNGEPLAISQIPVKNRRLPSMTTVETLAYTASLLGFKGTGFEFLADNVRNLHQDKILNGRNAVIQSFSVRSPDLDPKAPEYVCKTSNSAR